MTRRAGALALLLLLVAVAPLTLAQGDAEDRHEVSVSILAYHPYPDPDAAAGLGGDPFGVEEYPRAPKDRMAGYYGAYWFPTVRFDGVLESSANPESPASDVETLYRAYDGHVRERLDEDAPLSVRVEGELLANGTGRVAATFTPTTTVDSRRVALRLVVFEDGVHYDGGNGVVEHRFLVRHLLAPEHASLRAGEPVTVERTFNLSADWNPDRLGVVAFAQNEAPDAPAWREKEVLQSATFRFSQDGPTVQERKAVLMEMYTATWCEPCEEGDAALELVAEKYHVATVPEESGGWTYFRPPSPARVALALGVAALLAAVLWPRLKREGAP